MMFILNRVSSARRELFAYESPTENNLLQLRSTSTMASRCIGFTNLIMMLRSHCTRLFDSRDSRRLAWRSNDVLFCYYDNSRGLLWAWSHPLLTSLCVASVRTAANMKPEKNAEIVSSSTSIELICQTG